MQISSRGRELALFNLAVNSKLRACNLVPLRVRDGVDRRQWQHWLALAAVVAELAKVAALSRSTFFERFNGAVGVAPMEYLLTWRMALAKDLLRRNERRVADVAQRVGYSSASTFSVAFTRYVGRPPSQYAREEQVATDDP